jgi:hypothetical protein
MEHCAKKIGEAYFRTPRNTIKAFFDLLSVLEQNPDAHWEELLKGVEITPDAPLAANDDIKDDEGNAGATVEELASFKL